MHDECLSKNISGVLKNLKDVLSAHYFILAGGTGLSLHLGHRISLDLDFFTNTPFTTDAIYTEIKKKGLKPVIHHEEGGALTALVKETKVSMFHYPYPFIDERKEWMGIVIAGVLDISSMKVMAIAQRGAKKDFVDLYFVLQNIPFRKIAENMVRRFGRERINPLVIGKALVFFEDAEVDPDPQYCGSERPRWEDIKRFFTKNIKQIVYDIENI